MHYFNADVTISANFEGRVLDLSQKKVYFNIGLLE